MRPQQSPSPAGQDPAEAALCAVPPARIELSLAAAVESPGAAREAARRLMTGRVAEPCLADALLVIGELVANSIRHAQVPADAMIGVRAEVRADVVLLEVVDSGTSGSVVRRPPDLHDGGGFGLNIVNAVSRRWGVDRGAGTRVWAELGVAAAA